MGWSEWLSIYYGWQVKFNVDKVMHARGNNLNFSHTLQISVLIAVTEGRDLGNVSDSSAKTSVQCAAKGKC